MQQTRSAPVENVPQLLCGLAYDCLRTSNRITCRHVGLYLACGLSDEINPKGMHLVCCSHHAGCITVHNACTSAKLPAGSYVVIKASKTVFGPSCSVQRTFHNALEASEFAKVFL